MDYALCVQGGHVKQTLFIEFGDKIYVPRPTSANAGMARSIWIQKLLNKESYIVSPDTWDSLSKNNKVQKLIEYNDGYSIEDL
jgi:hypothetical protein